jgi:hypothetical protein
MTRTLEAVRPARRRQFLQQLAVVFAAGPALMRTARAAGRVNPPAILAVEAGNYRFLPAGGVFCGGVLPDEGYEVVHAILRPRLPLTQGYAFIESYLKNLGRPVQALCGMELRVPAPMTFDAFRAFNAPYVEQSSARSTVDGKLAGRCADQRRAGAERSKRSMRARVQLYRRRARESGWTFCIFRDRRHRSARRDRRFPTATPSPAGMKKKLEFCIEVIGNRLAELELESGHALSTFISVADMPGLGSTVLPPWGEAARRRASALCTPPSSSVPRWSWKRARVDVKSSRFALRGASRRSAR